MNSKTIPYDDQVWTENMRTYTIHSTTVLSSNAVKFCPSVSKKRKSEV